MLEPHKDNGITPDKHKHKDKQKAKQRNAVKPATCRAT